MTELRRSRYLHFLLPLWAFVICSCANVAVPPGGEEDKIGPFVTAHFPEADAVDVSRHLTAWLEFSEPVNRPTVEAALFLSPDPLQRLRYRWHGRVLELLYLDSLQDDRTHVISVGTQAKDLRGNTAAGTFTLAFSTGDHIDRGRIEGWIAGEETPQGVSLWAYRLSETAEIDPMAQAADYRIQADAEGYFRFRYLSPGVYRVLAATDKDFDGLWNPSREWIGLPPWDVVVTDTTMPWLSFQLMLRDSAEAAIRGVKEIDQRRIEVRLSRPVQTLAAVFTGPDTVHILDAYSDPEAADTWRVFPERELESAAWTIHARGLDDLQARWENSRDFEVRARADTAGPKILTVFPEERERLIDCPDSILFEFDEPVLLNPDSAFSLLTADNTDTLQAQITQSQSRVVAVVPDLPLSEGKAYAASFSGAAIRDLSGNRLNDSLVTTRFSVYPADSLGELLLDLKTGQGDQYLIRILRTVDRNEVSRMTVIAPSVCRFSRLPSGSFIVEITRDRNRDGLFSPGTMVPFAYAEPFKLYPDTVAVRARWENEITFHWKENP